MSADVCIPHQTAYSREDPCPFCMLEVIKKTASKAKKGTDLGAKNIALDCIYQFCKDRLALRKVLNGK